MASNPPFQVEDTDEDFFDKLVDDVDDYKVSPPSSGEGVNLADGDDSDEARAFANLSISDVGTGFEDSGKVGVGEEQEDKKASSSINGDFKDKPSDTHVEPGRPIVLSNSFAFDNDNEEPNNGTMGLEDSLNSTARENHRSAGATGVKEVQWSAFTADAADSGSNGFGSYPDFFTEFGDGSVGQAGKGATLTSASSTVTEVGNSLHVENANDYSHQFQEGQTYATAGDQSTDAQDPNSSQYWENLYPGWRYDANTGQWYQVDQGYDGTASVQGTYSLNSASGWPVADEKSEVSYLQQTAQSFTGAVAEEGTTENVTSWNQNSQENNGYPSHMFFDPQYPGWYYDMNAQEWRSLDAYNSQPTGQTLDQVNQNGFSATGTYYGNDHKIYGEQGQLNRQGSEAFSNQGEDYNWNGSYGMVEQQGSSIWQPNTVAKSTQLSDSLGSQQVHSHYGTNFHVDNLANQSQSYHYGGTTSSFEKASRSEFPSVSGAQTFIPGGNFSHKFNQSKVEQSEAMNLPKAYGNQNQLSYSQQQVQTGQQLSYASPAGRSSAERPPHALVAFGFGGKLIVMKDSTSLINASYAGQESRSGSISVINLAEVVTGRPDVSSGGPSICDYFGPLCRQSFPGPLTGGSVGSKELNKWIDERIAHTESSEMDYRKSDVLKLLLSLLKIASQHYGKFRSPFGADTTSKENDAPEVAVARLFASTRRNGSQYNDYSALTHCLQQLPSEGQIMATAAEVQTLLVSGRKLEALYRAQEGQLWGPALVLAAQLGDQYYVDTVKKMALRQLVAGSPLRTLCLLIAGQPADVFSATAEGGIPDAVHMSQQPVQAQPGANGMLDDWEENLAVITANRTKDDELVLIHLGDCLWKERSNIIAAHICYLVAEANFEPYSDSARLCLIGADHWKHPRTYASPEAIQRTEVYEYSKLQGNSQFTLLSFQPYKLIYAHMLAEVGRVSDSLKYCQAISKSLKTGRAPEVETWRQLVSSLEDRIKTHQQGGFSTNLAPAKLVGKLLNLFDSTAHRVVGGLPPPVPSASGGVQNDRLNQPIGPRVSTSQSTMAMSSLVPSDSTEPINQRTAEGNSRRIIHNRSVSEPDFGRSPRQVDSSKESSADSQSKGSGVTSRLGRFGFGSQLLQKTVGLVLKPRQDKQAKLGETNKFYYDEKLKRWVEEGAEPPAEEAALPPPPTMATFQNGTSDYSLKSALKTEGSHSNGSPEFSSPTSVGRSSGIPPIPATSNQFSARGRMGVRARYVDTFNQGGGGGGYPTNLFQSPSASSIKPPPNPNPKFFVPAPVPAEQSIGTPPDEFQEQGTSGNRSPSNSSMHDSFQSPPHSSSPMALQRNASMGDMLKAGASETASYYDAPHSRRTASWSAGINEGYSSQFNRSELKPLGEVLGMPPSSFMPSEPGLTHSSMNGGSFSDELQEVEL